MTLSPSYVTVNDDVIPVLRHHDLIPVLRHPRCTQYLRLLTTFLFALTTRACNHMLECRSEQTANWGAAHRQNVLRKING